MHVVEPGQTLVVLLVHTCLYHELIVGFYGLVGWPLIVVITVFHGSSRQAPHYYKPYFGYLCSFIMSYALHIVWLIILFTLHLESLTNLVEAFHLNNGNGNA